MRKTWAHNGIFVGILIGILVYAWTSSIILCLLAAVAVSVVCFKLIRALENVLYKGADKVVGQLNARHDRLAAEKRMPHRAWHRTPHRTGHRIPLLHRQGGHVRAAALSIRRKANSAFTAESRGHKESRIQKTEPAFFLFAVKICLLLCGKVNEKGAQRAKVEQ